MRVNISDLEKYKHYDSNCRQCQQIEKYGKWKAGLGHTDARRRELLRKMGETEEGKAFIESHKERVDRGIAERIGHKDNKGQQTATTTTTTTDLPSTELESKVDETE